MKNTNKFKTYVLEANWNFKTAKSHLVIRGYCLAAHLRCGDVLLSCITFYDYVIFAVSKFQFASNTYVLNLK